MLGPASRWLTVALAVGLLAAVGVLGVGTAPVRLVPRGPGWERCVAGVGPGGGLRGTGTFEVPGVDRTASVVLEIEAGGPAGRPARLGVTAEGGATEWQDVSGAAQRWTLPATGVPGVLVRLSASEGTTVRLRAIELRSTGGPPWRSALLIGVAAAGLTLALGPALGLWAAGLSVVAASPLVLLWTLPQPASVARVALAVLPLAAGVAMGWRGRAPRRFAFGAALLAAAVFGVWGRAYFLPSAGSWDTDYWKACMLRVAGHGVTRAYGDPGSVAPGHVLEQLRGAEPLWEAEASGRTFVVDQPPGIMAAWKASWWLATRVARRMAATDLENAAAKLPAVAGDLLAVAVLLWAFRSRPERGLTLAALYWALPVSWLSSAVLGFFDGACAPLAVAALIAAGRGRAGLSGLLLALAACVKSTALLVAPAVLVALVAARAPLRRAVACGLAVVAIALIPFLLDGTLATALIHMYRIFFQKRLSGGFANAWWLVGYLISVARGTSGLTAPVLFVHVQSIAFPVNALGTALFVLVALGLGRLQWRAPGPFAATLAGAALVVTYGMVAIGVHENHPHVLVLAFLATGLPSRRLRWLAGAFLTTYVLNMLALSGLGRFYGPRHRVLEPLVTAVAGFRMSPGFDVTLLLAVANLVAYAILLGSFKAELERGR